MDTVDIKALNERIQQESSFVDMINMEMNKVIVGQKHLVEGLLLSNGHILLEGVPGLAKTLAINTLATTIDAKFSRIQFTPDLLPADVIGTMIYSQKREEFVVKQGPIFANFILADEINRTSPKTQSALLEVMEEHTITVDGETHVLPAPFICIATQNPLGSAGTQPLPQSQIDRFMVCLSIGYPTLENQMKIINAQRYNNPIEDIHTVASAQNLLEVQNYLTSVRMTDSVLAYAIRLCEETRTHPLVELGISPRGVSALVKMARANAILRERNYVVPEDVQNVFLDVCAHRLALRPQARIEGMTAQVILQDILKKIKPTQTEG